LHIGNIAKRNNFLRFVWVGLSVLESHEDSFIRVKNKESFFLCEF
jgi:hypothetical protein